MHMYKHTFTQAHPYTINTHICTYTCMIQIVMWMQNNIDSQAVTWHIEELYDII